MFDYDKIPDAFKLLISIFYIVVGILLMTDLFSVFDSWKRFLFGAVVIGYGMFRMYTAWKRTRKKA